MCVNAVDAAFRTPAPTLACKLVMLCLAHHKNFRSGLCFVSGQTIAAETGLDIRSVRRAIDKLVNPGEGEGPALISVLPALRQGTRSEVSRYVLDFANGLSVRRLMDEDADKDAATVAGILSEGSDRESVSRKRQGDSASTPGVTPDPEKAPNRDGESPKQEDNRKDVTGSALTRGEDSGSVDYKMAVELIWRSVGDFGRKRSSKKDIDKSLRAAIGRRPKGVTQEGHLRRVLLGLRAYLATDEARKENGAFEKGTHRVIANDRWESYLDDDKPRPADQLPVDPEIGTDDQPGPALQALWAELASQGMPWNEDRGPRPGRPGCRISPDIQRQYGFEPWAGEQPLEQALAAPLALPAPADDDCTAFV